MQRRCGFHIRILLHRLWRSPLSEGASYIRSPTGSRDIFALFAFGRGAKLRTHNSTNQKSSLSVDFRSFVWTPPLRGTDSRNGEGIPFHGGSKPPPYGWDTEGVLSVLVGCDNLCLPFEGREGWGVCEYEDAPPLRISHTHSPPPPMAEPFSLRLGHARALTTVQVVIHSPRAASLPYLGKATVFPSFRERMEHFGIVEQRLRRCNGYIKRQQYA